MHALRIRKLISTFILRFKGLQQDFKGPVSIVLLLRSPVSLNMKGNLFPGSGQESGQNPIGFIPIDGARALVHLKTHLISLFAVSQPYFGDDARFVESLPEENQRKVWRSHHAWISLDHLGKSEEIDQKYCVLAGLASEILNDNCVGIYIPREKRFTPNDASLRHVLKKLQICEQRP